MLRCRSIASLQRTVSTPPLVDFSRASPLDLFQQPARAFFQQPARLGSLFHRRLRLFFSSRLPSAFKTGCMPVTSLYLRGASARNRASPASQDRILLGGFPPPSQL